VSIKKRTRASLRVGGARIGVPHRLGAASEEGGELARYLDPAVAGRYRRDGFVSKSKKRVRGKRCRM